MKIVFLDVDGVLNHKKSKTKFLGYIGIDNDKVLLLKEIIDKTNAKIVLCSSWKINWEPIEKEYQDRFANYLDQKLKEENLYILDKTDDYGENRGEGIYNWLENKCIESWVVLDDEIFDDYEKYGIIEHLIKTEFYEANGGGLNKEHVENAIRILNNCYQEE